uniref:Uncharacterized protein n=1 Tax=Anguilla anguilla TaxID=7936 RepID=A0A0E9Q5J7_ANGAN
MSTNPEVVTDLQWEEAR